MANGFASVSMCCQFRHDSLVSGPPARVSRAAKRCETCVKIKGPMARAQLQPSPRRRRRPRAQLFFASLIFALWQTNAVRSRVSPGATSSGSKLSVPRIHHVRTVCGACAVDVDIPRRKVGRRVNATWIFRGDESPRRRGRDVDIPWRRSRGDAAAATWTFRGEKSRRRRGRDVRVPSRRAGPNTSPKLRSMQECRAGPPETETWDGAFRTAATHRPEGTGDDVAKALARAAARPGSQTSLASGAWATASPRTAAGSAARARRSPRRDACRCPRRRSGGSPWTRRLRNASRRATRRRSRRRGAPWPARGPSGAVERMRDPKRRDAFSGGVEPSTCRNFHARPEDGFVGLHIPRTGRGGAAGPTRG